MLVKKVDYITIAEIIDLIDKRSYKSDEVKRFLALPYNSKYMIVKEFIIKNQMQEDFNLALLIDYLDYENWEVLVNEK